MWRGTGCLQQVHAAAQERNRDHRSRAGARWALHTCATAVHAAPLTSSAGCEQVPHSGPHAACSQPPLTSRPAMPLPACPRTSRCSQEQAGEEEHEQYPDPPAPGLLPPLPAARPGARGGEGGSCHSRILESGTAWGGAGWGGGGRGCGGACGGGVRLLASLQEQLRCLPPGQGPLPGVHPSSSVWHSSGGGGLEWGAGPGARSPQRRQKGTGTHWWQAASDTSLPCHARMYHLQPAPLFTKPLNM